ncbi:hypothetical protein ACS0TY_036011 [Phlomoides rotata]
MLNRRLSTLLSGSVSTGNERVANKLKGYFDLVKEEIDKAVHAEELGSPKNAISHYRLVDFKNVNCKLHQI